MIEVLKKALEALKAVHIVGGTECVMTPDGEIYLQPAITSLRQAIAELESQEPVANELAQLKEEIALLTPNDDHVICPNCIHQFRAIPVNVQKLMLGVESQEPVAWLEPEWGEKICPEVGYEVTMIDDHPRDLCWIPLYPHTNLRVLYL